MLGAQRLLHEGQHGGNVESGEGFIAMRTPEELAAHRLGMRHEVLAQKGGSHPGHVHGEDAYLMPGIFLDGTDMVKLPDNKGRLKTYSKAELAVRGAERLKDLARRRQGTSANDNVPLRGHP